MSLCLYNMQKDTFKHYFSFFFGWLEFKNISKGGRVVERVKGGGGICTLNEPPHINRDFRSFTAR